MFSKLVAISCCSFLAVSASAQDAGSADVAHVRTVSLIGGAAQYDLSGTGTAALFGARGSLGINRWFVGEIGINVMRPQEQFSQHATYLFPEFQLQAQIPFRVVRPYVGVGAGSAIASAAGYLTGSTRTTSVAGGLRAFLPGTATALQGELRVRGIGPRFTSAMADWTLGLGRRF